MMNFAVFGTHPSISAAELQAVFPSAEILKVGGGKAAIFELGTENRELRIEEPSVHNSQARHSLNSQFSVLNSRLGGTVKTGEILASMPTGKVDGETLAELVASRLKSGSKFHYGLTVYGAASEKLAMMFKKALKQRSISSRWVTSDAGEDIAPAAIAKLDLINEGLDLCIFVEGKTAHIGVTTAVQDATAWSHRDYDRPCRDTANGMLPPKLARMLVNLASPPSNGTLLDPFCGGGTILMEAALAFPDVQLIGSDIEPKQIADTKKNIDWLITEGILSGDDRARIKLFVADARDLTPHLAADSVDVIATEGYLGPQLRGIESQLQIEKNATQIEALWRASLGSFKTILKPEGRVVGIWPTFTTKFGTTRINLKEKASELRWHQVIDRSLAYHREGQSVYRNIFVWEE